MQKHLPHFSLATATCCTRAGTSALQEDDRPSVRTLAKACWAGVQLHLSLPVWHSCMSQSNGALQERDEAKTRKLAEARLSKEEREDLERRKYTTEEEKEGLLPQLRWASLMLLCVMQTPR